jgi:hypothetical protein
MNVARACIFYNIKVAVERKILTHSLTRHLYKPTRST